MHYLAKYGAVNLTKTFYRSEWLNAENNDGLTPIMRAFDDRCNNELARVLLNKCANLNCKDKRVEYSVYISLCIHNKFVSD